MKILHPAPASAEANMARDRELLEALRDTPILHLYEWEGDCATYGYFIKPEEHLQPSHLSLARRPTGGGIIFHTCDLAFSFLLPASHQAFSINTLETYAWVNERVLRAIRRFLGKEPELLPSDPEPLDPASRHFCMAKPTIYDVMLEGRKVGGAAQRRTKKGLLHQGSISLVHPKREFLERVLLPGTRVLEAMEQHSYALVKDHLEEARQQLRLLLVEEFN